MNKSAVKLFPIRKGEKVPALSESWKTVATDEREKLSQWLHEDYWFGLPCGVINDGLEVLDVDDPDLIEPVRRRVEKFEDEWAIEIPMVWTRKGLHVYFRSAHCEGNQKLAMSKEGNVLIETRGEGGYVVSPSTNNDVYQFVAERGYADISVLSEEQRTHLMDYARSYNEVFPEVYVPQEYTGTGRPGDDFNNRAKWEEILKGWDCVKQKGEYREWRRPGKEVGSISATTGHDGRDIMYLFSSNAGDMESNRAYSKFSAFVFLEHQGDFKAATKALVERGYGTKKEKHDPLRALYDIANERERFRDDLGKVYIRDDHGRAINVKTEKYKAWLDAEYMGKFSKLARETHLNDISAKMQRTWQQEISVLATRLAWDEATIWVDLGDKFVRVQPKGWALVDESDLLFNPSLVPQVHPIPNQDNLDSLRPYVNVRDEDWIQFQAWLLGMFIGGGTYPIMVINGGEDTGKSFVTRLCRKLVDPTVPELAKYPKSLEDIDTQASAQFLLCYDNLSSLPLSLSDVFCTIASGTGVIRRALYTNEEPFIRQWKRPIVINGINETLARRQDFNSRAIVFDLPSLAGKQKFEEKQAWAEVNAKMPGWLGSILSAVVYGMNNPTELRPNIRLTDFGAWVTSCLPYFGYTQEEVVEALEHNHKMSKFLLIEADMVSKYLILLLDARKKITKASTQLLYQLTSELVQGDDRRSKDWPGSTVQFGIALSRAASTLAAIGYHVERVRSSVGYLYTLEKLDEDPSDS